jgi:hypothetical protein
MKIECLPPSHLDIVLVTWIFDASDVDESI